MRPLLPLTLLALLLPVAPAAAGWGPDRLQTHAGRVTGVAAAGGNGDRIALGWPRDLGGVQRAELRLGRARDGFTHAPLVLDRNPRHSVETPRPEYVRDGAFAAAWLRFEDGSHRLRLRTVDRRGRLGATTRLTGGGESAYYPAWADGAGSALQWSRRTRADGAILGVAGLQRLRLPAPPVSEPSASTGLRTLSWVNDSRVLVSDREGGSYSTPQTIATGEVNYTTTVRVKGATLVFWRQDTNLMVAARPADGATFGPPRELVASTTYQAETAVTSTGEVLVVLPTGDSSDVGALQLLRLGADGAPLAPARQIGRGRFAQLATDGTGSAFVAWMAPGIRRAVTVQRIATGGILGRPMRMTAHSDASRLALAATREGGAVLAWVRDGQVHARTYRP